MSGGRPKALLITPAFFGYEQDIVAELERQGYDATLLDERPSNSAAARAVMRVRKPTLGIWIESYYRSWVKDLEGVALDLVLVIKAEVVPRWFLHRLRVANPRAHFVFYAFDSMANAGNCRGVIDLFDRRFTFDRADAERLDGFEYLPLFYTQEFYPLDNAESAMPRTYELSFVGTLHSDRYLFATTLFEGLKRVFSFFYVQARWYFAVAKYVTRENRRVSWREASFARMPRTQVAEIFRNSLAVLDMQRDGQTGLTMRTFEVLASGAILVTTNAAIMREPFYDPTRILVVPLNPSPADRDELHAQLRRLGQPTRGLSGIQSYCLASWVNSLTDTRAISPIGVRGRKVPRDA